MCDVHMWNVWLLSVSSVMLLTEQRKSMVDRRGCLERVAFLGSFVRRLQPVISSDAQRALQTDARALLL